MIVIEVFMSQTVYDVQVLLPVHNEAESIEQTIREIYAELSQFVRVQFILCEDGSRDNSKEVLRRVAETIPAKLLLSDARKGYSGAVRDGMLAMDAGHLLCLDSPRHHDHGCIGREREKVNIQDSSLLPRSAGLFYARDFNKMSCDKIWKN